MKQMKRIYIILSFLFFIYPPFIWGLVNIYAPRDFDTSHITTLYANITLVLLLGLICFVLIKTDKLHIPSKEEIKYLIFGFIGNVLIYLYTFQDLMNTDRVINIYLILLIILITYYILIKQKIQPLELWLTLPIFLVYDYMFILIRGCGWAEWSCNVNNNSDSYLYVLFIIIIVYTLLFYIYKLILYRLIDVFKIINIIVVTIMSVAVLAEWDLDEKFLLTLAILWPFFLIVDFVVKIVTKQFDSKMVLFYIRTLTIFVIATMIASMDLNNGNMDGELLGGFVIITYVSFGISILRFLLNIDIQDENPLKVVKGTYQTKYRIAKLVHLEHIRESFGDVMTKKVQGQLETTSILLKDNHVSALLSAEIKYVDTFSEPILEANISAVEIEDCSYTDVQKLYDLLVKELKSQGVSQVRVYIKKSKTLKELVLKRKFIIVSDHLLNNENHNGYTYIKHI